ncbi:MAG TPA: hypothetical protein VMT33_01305, partial [Candidatus Bathyarchaeia archaeon]|nr:hypothetical protein [Candidatus Bathyarchaeia archaeon]
LYGVMKSRPRWAYGATAAAALAGLLLVVIAAPPLIGAARSAKPLVDAVPQLASSRPLVLVDRNLPSLTYYVDRVPEKVEGRLVGERLDRGDAPLLVITDRDFEKLPLEVKRRLKLLGRAGNLAVYEPNSPAP